MHLYTLHGTLSFVLLIYSLHHVASTTITVQLDPITVNEQWSHWKQTYKKQYASEEEHDYRRGQWIKQLVIVMQHNINYDLGLATYSMGLNKFSDMDWIEFRTQYLGGHISPVNRVVTPFNWTDMSVVPSKWDWRDHGMVGPVLDQGNCRSCWAFAAVGSIEGQYKKKYGKLLQFSKQQLVDCSRPFHNRGCGGGSSVNAFEYLKKNGLELESTYPYKAKDQKCTHDPKKAITRVKSYQGIQNGDEKQLAAMVAKFGPVSAAVNAIATFKTQKETIFDDPNCTASPLNHEVLIVGYGDDNGKEYWIIKSAWGKDWGVDGCIKLARNRGNLCGIASDAVVPELV